MQDLCRERHFVHSDRPYALVEPLEGFVALEKLRDFLSFGKSEAPR